MIWVMSFLKVWRITKSYKLPVLVTVDDLKRMGAGQKKEDAPLMTKTLREQQKSRQMASDFVNYPVCRVKFSLPNQIVAEIGFHPGETVATMKSELTKLFESNSGRCSDLLQHNYKL